MRIRNGRALLGGELRHADVLVADEDGRRVISFDGPRPKTALEVDASGLLVLPGLVDIHGDAFERQIMPRPGVRFDLETALFETDRQLSANGITTGFHGLTWSWEPGFRGAESARAFVAALDRLRPTFAVDTRLHLRHETYNLDAEDEIKSWMAEGRVALLAFNDHMTGTITTRNRPDKLAEMVKRSGVTTTEFQKLIDNVAIRSCEVSPSIARLAATARELGVPMLSHDDLTPASRAEFRAMGAAIAEFPVTAEVASDAVDHGDTTVFGAPNVLRGGSHTGCPAAAEMVAAGCCSVLASDYYYPALLQAPFVLERKYGVPLARGWQLVSAAPAAAAGLNDRGCFAQGARADIVLVAPPNSRPARIVATIADGRLVHLSEPHRLARQMSAP